MKLKWQVVTIALFSLSFPVVVWLVFWQLNLSYQNNLLATTIKQADVLKSSIAQQHNNAQSHLTGLIASPLAEPISIDGRDDDWQNVPWYRVDKQLSFRWAYHGEHSYLWVQVADDSPVLFAENNQTESGDLLTLAYIQQDKMLRVILKRQAEGKIINSEQQPLEAWWHESAAGYALEIKLPRGTVQKIGLVATDRAPNQNINRAAQYYGHFQNNFIQLQDTFIVSKEWQKMLQQLTPEDSRLTLLDNQQRNYYDINKMTRHPVTADWITTVLYPIIFATDDNSRQLSNLSQQQIRQPFGTGELVFTVAHPQSHITLIETFIKAIGLLIGIALILLLLFFVYALLLTWRIRRLSQRLKHVLDDSGAIHSQLPSLHAGDEIGDLARGMNHLLQQINAYTDYLKQLGQRLSHEMKTPIGIVQSSLDNIELAAMTPDQQVFIERALKANHRLKFILNQLSRLSQWQRTIADAEYSSFDLNALLTELMPAYRSVRHEVDYQGPDQPLFVNGNPELMAQLLDKIIENAFDFAEPHSTITIQLSTTDSPNCYHLHIRNQGPQIKAEQLPRLFESLQSFRSQQDSKPHLGIGLYLVKLIAEFHKAEVKVINLEQPSGVCFQLSGYLNTPDPKKPLIKPKSTTKKYHHNRNDC